MQQRSNQAAMSFSAAFETYTSASGMTCSGRSSPYTALPGGGYVAIMKDSNPLGTGRLVNNYLTII
jgi:hypothetical protein